MKNSDVMDMFLDGYINRYKTNCLRLEGGKLYSYNTLLARREGDKILLNTTKYSRTTSKCQNYIKRKILNYVAVENIPMGGNF